MSSRLVTWVKSVPWKRVVGAGLAAVPLVAVFGAAALAQTTGGAPPIQYGNPSTPIANQVTTALEGVAQTIRWILGGTALVALLFAAFMNHMPNQRSKEMAKEIVAAAVVGLLIAAFAPNIVNWVAGL